MTEKQKSKGEQPQPKFHVSWIDRTTDVLNRAEYDTIEEVATMISEVKPESINELHVFHGVFLRLDGITQMQIVKLNGKSYSIG